MKDCINCKWRDKEQLVYWRGEDNFFYVCKKEELQQQAANNRDNKKREIFAPSYLDKDGKQHGLQTCLDELDEQTKKYLGELQFN